MTDRGKGGGGWGGGGRQVGTFTGTDSSDNGGSQVLWWNIWLPRSCRHWHPKCLSFQVQPQVT